MIICIKLPKSSLFLLQLQPQIFWCMIFYSFCASKDWKRLKNVSDRLVCSTGGPQGTVLTLFLFTHYTAGFSINSPHCQLQKFPIDSTIVGRSHVWRDFVDLCQLNHLLINVGKTKKLVGNIHMCRPTTLHFTQRSFWSPGSTTKDLFWLSGGIKHLLWHSMLEQKCIYSWEEEVG